jgi:hypothetical protein
MNQESLCGQLPPIDERERGILFSILLMLNLFAALAQTGIAAWFLLSNLLNYPANLGLLLTLAICGFYLASVLGLLHWKKWAYFSYCLCALYWASWFSSVSDCARTCICRTDLQKIQFI